MNRSAGHIRGLVIVAAVTALIFTACKPPVGSKVALRQTPKTPQIWDLSDPFVAVSPTSGRVFAYGSTSNVRVPLKELNLSNMSLANTRDVTNAMPQHPSWAKPGTHIWAPTVAYFGGRWRMYYAAEHKDSSLDRLNSRCVGLANAGSPLGPFVPTSSPVYCGLPAERGSNAWGRGAIDPEVFKAPDGKVYLLVSLGRTNDNIGVVRLGTNGQVSGGRNASPWILAGQSLNYHDGTDDGSLKRPTVLENPSMIHDPATGTYLLFYSAGHWDTPRYLTGFARCAAPTGPCSLDERGPFLRNGNGREGAGGLSAFRDASGQARVIYSTWRQGEAGQHAADGSKSRKASVSRLTIAGAEAATQTVRLDP